MDKLLMSVKERARLEIFSRVREAELTLSQASEVLNLSYRHTHRSYQRYLDQGDAGLVHGLRGKASNRQGDLALQQRVLQIYAEKYADYGPTLAAECLQSDDSIQVPVETLRRWLKAEGLWSARRQRKKHRQRRPRKECVGEMIQMDGSIHDWFEGRRGEAVLMVLIDDATGHVLAQFVERENLRAAWSAFRMWIETHGLPGALYVDQASIYRSDREPTAEELLARKKPPTQFGRSLEQLGVRLIMAGSAQAKGRVERMNSTLQDRLVKALRRKGICELESANDFLRKEFLPAFNEHFEVDANSSSNAHRKVDVDLDLDVIFAVQEERTVQNDWTVRWRNRFLQLSHAATQYVQPKQKVMVAEQADEKVRVFAGEVELTWSPTRSEPASERGESTGDCNKASAGEASTNDESVVTGKQPQSEKQATDKRGAEIRSSQGQIPAAGHPWRSFQISPPTTSAPQTCVASTDPPRKRI